MVSTDFPGKLAYRERLVRDSSAVTVSTNTIAFGGANTGIPGFIRATAATFINFPVEQAGQDMFFNIIYDSPCTNSTIRYPAVAVQLRPTSAGGYPESTGDSTRQSAFKVFLSTGVFVATSTEADSYMLGPIDTYKYGCNYLGTSSNSVDKHQNFVRMLVGYSTAGVDSTTAISTVAFMSTTPPIGFYYVKPMQVASTK